MWVLWVLFDSWQCEWVLALSWKGFGWKQLSKLQCCSALWKNSPPGALILLLLPPNLYPTLQQALIGNLLRCLTTLRTFFCQQVGWSPEKEFTPSNLVNCIQSLIGDTSGNAAVWFLLETLSFAQEVLEPKLEAILDFGRCFILWDDSLKLLFLVLLIFYNCIWF